MTLPLSKALCYFSFLVVLSGCTADQNAPNASVDFGSSNGPSVPQPDVSQPKLNTSGELSPHAARLADAVQQSQARLASSTTDVCPKLIEFKVGDTVNFRQNEKMRSQHCKYFIYPKLGDKIAVSVSNSKMKAEMAQPKYFNFVDGVYTVSKSGKHVLQISYKDYHGSRPAENYDLMVSTS